MRRNIDGVVELCDTCKHFYDCNKPWCTGGVDGHVHKCKCYEEADWYLEYQRKEEGKRRRREERDERNLKAFIEWEKEKLMAKKNTTGGKQA